MAEWFVATATSGSLLAALPVAVVAGLVSFFTPCVIPLVPAWLSYATGLSGVDLATADFTRAQRGRLALGTLLFVLGFAAVFVVLGIAAGGVGNWLFAQRDIANRVLGILLVVLGVAFIGGVRGLQRTWRPRWTPRAGLAAAPLVGVLFGIGWTPCVGPTLGAITALSYDAATAGRGALLSGAFALGLGLPFLVAGVFYERALAAFAVVRRHTRVVQWIGGLMLIALGVAMLTGVWEDLVAWLQLTAIDVSTPAV